MTTTDAPISPFSYRLSPLNGIERFTAGTRALLDRFAELGLHTHYGDSWSYPKPTMTINFGAGSGWTWGTVTITHTGRLSHMKARWLDRDGAERIDVADGPTAIRAELERHAQQRLGRLTWLAERNGLLVVGHNRATTEYEKAVAELLPTAEDKAEDRAEVNAAWDRLESTPPSTAAKPPLGQHPEGTSPDDQ